jgi:hypothetical protein
MKGGPIWHARGRKDGSEIFKEYHFAFQMKDNANIFQRVPDNFTEVGF